MQKHLVVLSGAGISQESGIQTFRDADGLWQGHDIMQVASLDGWYKDKDLVLDFYNKRRAQLLEVQPNQGHLLLVELEKHFKVSIITQNVDNLHEKAGSQNVLHLHGELLKVRSTQEEHLVYPWNKDLTKEDKNDLGHSLRPHIVWFGEMVPMMQLAQELVEKADILLIIGTSLQVYPAAGLMDYVKANTPIYYIDPNPVQISSFNTQVTTLKQIASKGLEKLFPLLKDLA